MHTYVWPDFLLPEDIIINELFILNFIALVWHYEMNNVWKVSGTAGPNRWCVKANMSII